jgi:hypothetical protein
VPGPFDGLDQHTLVPGTRSGDPLWNDPALLRDEPLQPFFVLVFDVDVLGFTEPADALLADLLCPG